MNNLEKLLHKLREKFKDKIPTRKVNKRDIAYMQGQQLVIRYIEKYIEDLKK